MNRYLPEGMLIATLENQEYLATQAGLERALDRQRILESVALLCDGEMNLHFDLNGIPGILPRSEVQYSPKEEIKDIAVLTRVGKPVAFKVIGFTRTEDGRSCALLSRKRAQLECLQHYISDLCPGDIVPAAITHMEPFGAFVDIGCGIVSLLSIDCISVSRISHPGERFAIGERIYAVVKRIDEEGRIYVTHRELLGTWEENAALFTPGQTVAGIVRSVESYGIFVELAPNLAGLAELKPGVRRGESAAVYIKSILPDKMKIKLILIDTHLPPERKKLHYFTDFSAVTHLDRWVYSPDACEKRIETVFDE